MLCNAAGERNYNRIYNVRGNYEDAEAECKHDADSCELFAALFFLEPFAVGSAIVEQHLGADVVSSCVVHILKAMTMRITQTQDS